MTKPTKKKTKKPRPEAVVEVERSDRSSLDERAVVTERADEKAVEPQAPAPETGLGPAAPRGDLLAIFGATFALRLAYFFTANGPAFRNPLIDGDHYDFLAEQISTGAGLPPEPFWQPPLFPLVTGALYKVFGHTLLAPRLLSAFATSLVAVLVTDLVRRATSSRLASLVGGAVIALAGPAIFYDGELLPTSLGTFLGTAALWLALTRAPLPDRSVTSGVVVGLGGIALGPLLFLAPVLGWVASAGQGLGRSGRALRTLVTCLSAAMIVLPVTVFNYRRGGELIPISANAGINLWIGNNPKADETFAIRPGEAWEAMLAEPGEKGVTTAAGQDAYFSQKARSFCVESPGACIAGLVHKARLLVIGREIPRNEDIYVLARQSPVLRATVWRVGPFAFPFSLIFPFAIGGLLAAFTSADERTRRVAIATGLALVALALGPIVFLVAGRYRIPMLPPLAILAGLGVAALPRWPTLATGGAVAAFVLTLVPAKLPVDAVDFEAEMWFVVGGRRERLADADGAIASYRHALERRPAYTEAGFNLGVLLEKQERFGEAIEVYRGMLRAQPNMFGVRYRLVLALLSAERLDEAERDLDKLLADVPDHPTLMTTRAKILLLRDRVPEAKQWCLRAMEATEGQHPEAQGLLGIIERIEAAGEGEKPE